MNINKNYTFCNKLFSRYINDFIKYLCNPKIINIINLKKFKLINKTKNLLLKNGKLEMLQKSRRNFTLIKN